MANFDVNVVGTFRVLDAARRAGVERTVQASTGGALIGDATPPVDELSLPKPISPYGASKLAGEGYAHAFAKTYGLRTVALRFANVYGPWSGRKQGAMTKFFQALARAASPSSSTATARHPATTRTWTTFPGPFSWPWRTTCPAARCCISPPGVETTVSDLADLCRAAAGLPDHPVEYRPKRPGEVDRNFASYDLAKQVLGYTPSISREEGIRSTWQWFQEEVFTD